MPDTPEPQDHDIVAEIFSPRVASDPLPAYADLLTSCPVSRAETPFGGSVLISDYTNVRSALRTPGVFSSAGVVEIGNEFPLIPLSVDPPEHAKYRRLLDPEFSPARMAALEPEARALTHRVLDSFVGDGYCDFHEQFATPIPSTVFLALCGLPQEDLDQFLRWRDDTIRPQAKTAEEAQQIRDAAGSQITNYFAEAIAQKRKQPDERLLSRLVHAQVEDRDLTHAELLGICHLLLLAGLDTVTATLDCMIAYLAAHPDARHALQHSGDYITAVEELLRHQTPVVAVPRRVLCPADVAGVQIAAGDSVLLLLGSANVDPTEFDQPDQVLTDRNHNRHLAFGGGPHRCLGSHLARMELRVALAAWHERIGDYELATGTTLQYSPGIRQVTPLPLTFRTP